MFHIKEIWVKLRSSKFARDAFLLLVFNVTSRAIGLLGTAYAARCLGPFNLGVSSLIQTTVQQLALTFNGGFDSIAVRGIAAEKKDSVDITSSIVIFRISLAALVSIGWIFFCYNKVPSYQFKAWLLGIPLLVVVAARVDYTFQGLEKLPIQNAVNTGTSLLTAGIYLYLFYPGIFLGADLVVISAVGVLTTLFSWIAYYFILNSWPIVKISLSKIWDLLRESWKYWALAIFVFFYSLFQIQLVAIMLGPREAGIFRSAYLMASGLELLFNSVNNLLIARLVIWKKSSLKIMWSRQTQLVLIFIMIGVPLVITLFMGAPYIYNRFLGEAFRDGITIFRILVFGRLVVFLGQIYAWGLTATHQDTHFLIGAILGAIVSVSLNIIIIPFLGLIGVAMVTVFSEILVHLYFFFIMRRFVITQVT